MLSASSKDNIVAVYMLGWNNAFKYTATTAVWRTTGIWPLDLDVIEASAYTPTFDVTTRAVLPLPAGLPSILEAVLSHYFHEDIQVIPNAAASHALTCSRCSLRTQPL
jgi:hypothetical protein